MANRQVFKSTVGKIAPQANALNDAGGVAYASDAEVALAQLAMTGTINNTFYVTATTQLDRILETAEQCNVEYVGKVAVYAREHGHMKDVPACLLVHLTTRGADGIDVLKRVFNRVIDNGKMLRTFAQILRSGISGRKSFGSAIKRLVKIWLQNRLTSQLVWDSVGQNPSMGDVIKMVHPRPFSAEKSAMFAYLVGRPVNYKKLPIELQKLHLFTEALKNSDLAEIPEFPNVPFQMLTSLPLTTMHWAEIAQRASWTQLRMNLNTFERHGVFDSPEMVEFVARKLSNQELIRESGVFPYQIMTTYLAVKDMLPYPIVDALHRAMEYAVSNVACIRGRSNIVVAVDVSGSMRAPITGHRKGSTTVTRCVDVAALVAATFLRANPESTEVILFDTDIKRVNLLPQKNIMDNAAIMAKMNGGGTNCGAVLRHLNDKKRYDVETIIYVSDYESWFVNDMDCWHYTGRSDWPQMAVEWNKFVANAPNAKMVCIDLVPNTTSQVEHKQNILQVGGFGDSVFSTVANWLDGNGPMDWISQINSINIL